MVKILAIINNSIAGKLYFIVRNAKNIINVSPERQNIFFCKTPVWFILFWLIVIQTEFNNVYIIIGVKDVIKVKSFNI